jgi:hypothetical protein
LPRRFHRIFGGCALRTGRQSRRGTNHRERPGRHREPSSASPTVPHRRNSSIGLAAQGRLIVMLLQGLHIHTRPESDSGLPSQFII